ncbi:MAG: hypothetical protein K8T10_14090 [Candidatus Eremiobacteraeota bacterium]|nr:hypothetical protein [Candidatus Eremiobacteraeota bacterium]
MHKFDMLQGIFRLNRICGYYLNTNTNSPSKLLFTLSSGDAGAFALMENLKAK